MGTATPEDIERNLALFRDYKTAKKAKKKTYEFLPEAMIKYKISAPRIWQIIKRQKDKIKK